MQSTLDRFMSKVKVDNSTGCWEWQGGKLNGYGGFKHNKKMKKAHRFSYEIFVQTIAEGMFICHTCDNPSCVNPCHLFQGTPKDNTQDMLNKKRANKARGCGLPQAKLDAKKIKLIREFVKRFPVLPPKAKMSGSCLFLSRWLSVSQATISRAVNSENWTHVK